MKSILLSLLVFFLITSCAHNRMRFVKQPKQRIVKVEQVEPSSIYIDDAPEVIAPQRTTIRSSYQEETVAEDLKDEYESEVSSSFNWNTPAPTDSTKQEVVVGKPLDKETQAGIAEDDAESANTLMLGSLWSLLAIPLAGLGLVASAALFIFGRIKFNKAKRSSYITEDGKEFLEKARNKQIALMIIWTLLAAFAVVLFVSLLNM